jgi:dimethylaniline monooxygenase (N-oxide forming)
MVEYLRMYAEHNNLHPHFRLGCRVTNVARSPPNPSQWAITIQEENRESTELFDRVVVTTGPQSAPWSPSIPGRDEFGGIVIHSQEFKEYVHILLLPTLHA